MDSTTLANILAEPVNLTQQLVLATFGHNALEAGKMTFFEDHLPVFNEALREPILLEALEKKYADIKDGIYTPYSQREKKDSPSQIVDGQLQAQTGRKLPIDIRNFTKGTVLDSALLQSKARIKYIYIWSVECGASLVPLPSLEPFRQQYSEDDLDIIYLCLDSQEWHWRGQVNKHSLKGQHYLLNGERAQKIRDQLKVGSQLYMIIDAKGILHKEGLELWPNGPELKTTIDSLLKTKEILN
jgi:hypothetical protein